MDKKQFDTKKLRNIRIVMINNEDWYVGKDITDILGYNNSSLVIIRHVDKENRIKSAKDGWIISGNGFLDLVASSRKPEAKKMFYWITHELLPTIRKYGAYMTDEIIDKGIKNPDTLIDSINKIREDKQSERNLMYEAVNRN